MNDTKVDESYVHVMAHNAREDRVDEYGELLDIHEYLVEHYSTAYRLSHAVVYRTHSKGSGSSMTVADGMSRKDAIEYARFLNEKNGLEAQQDSVSGRILMLQRKNAEERRREIEDHDRRMAQLERSNAELHDLYGVLAGGGCLMESEIKALHESRWT